MAMALLRLNCFPSNTYLSTEQQQQQRLHLSPVLSLHKPQNNNNNLSLSWSFSRSHTFPIKPKRLGHFIFHVSAATTQNPLVDSSSSTETANTEENEELSKDRLIAQNVPWTSTAEDIRALFEMHGTVLDVELSMHNKTRNRGLAFVTMGSPEEALAALNNLESYEFEGRTLKVNYAKPKKKNPAAPPVRPKPITFNLFVANLSFEARANDLKEFFISEGCNIYSAEVVFHNNPRRSSGYGFVSFKTKKEADTALSAFEGKMFMGRPLRIAPSKQFVKVQPEEGLHSDDGLADLNSDAEESRDCQRKLKMNFCFAGQRNFVISLLIL
ncbi:hypothetical protein Dsin_028271 [Dipteronia sinensis]|uniref:RRM domain-containing protein n=1 Tax=Dipteronia sinensis TaxID=43782 RepID=A0AAE0DU91_9ROSI|nr:hypothetical protein Dsin_028271 [Dipteronia sinensis]